MKKKLLVALSLLTFAPSTLVFAQTDTEKKLEEIKQQIESLQAEYDKLAGEASGNASSDTATTDSKNLGKRSNPVPLGKMIALEETVYGDGDTKFTAKYTLGATNVVRGDDAYKLLLEYSEYNKPAPEGYEWAVFDMKLEYLEGDEDSAFHTPSYFKVFDSKGKEVKTTEYASLNEDDEFEYVELFPKSTHEGKIALVVPKGDDFLLVYDTFDNKIFFSTKK